MKLYYVLFLSFLWCVHTVHAVVVERLAALPLDTHITSLVMTSDGNHIVFCGADKAIHVLDVDLGQEVERLEGHTSIPVSVAVSQDGKYAASAGGSDHTVRLWNLELGHEERVWTEHTGYVRSVAFTPDGAHVISSGLDRTLRVWSVATGLEVRCFENIGTMGFIAFMPDGLHFVAGGFDGDIHVFNQNNGEEIRRFRGHTQAVRVVAITPDGRHIVSGGLDKRVRVWNMATGKLTRRFKYDGDITSLAITADGEYVILSTSDKAVYLVSIASGRRIFSLPRHPDNVHSVWITSDGRIAVGKKRALDLHENPLVSFAREEMQENYMAIEAMRNLLPEGHDDSMDGEPLSILDLRCFGAEFDRLTWLRALGIHLNTQ